LNLHILDSLEDRANRLFELKPCLSHFDFDPDELTDIVNSSYFPLVREVKTYGGLDLDYLKELRNLRSGITSNPMLAMRGVSNKFPWLHIFEIGKL
jgi:hypothetical protein